MLAGPLQWEWSRPLCSWSQVRRLKGPKPMAMQRSDWVTPLMTGFDTTVTTDHPIHLLLASQLTNSQIRQAYKYSRVYVIHGENQAHSTDGG